MEKWLHVIQVHPRPLILYLINKKLSHNKDAFKVTSLFFLNRTFFGAKFCE
jgi:hypothetical protein